MSQIFPEQRRCRHHAIVMRRCSGASQKARFSPALAVAHKPQWVKDLSHPGCPEQPKLLLIVVTERQEWRFRVDRLLAARIA
jgi:hypothetical protein